MLNLHIDTSDNKEINVSIKSDTLNDEINFNLNDTKSSQVVISQIDQLLSRNKLNIYNISSITVNTGPGSFTGLRVGLSIANMFAYLLEIPINNNEVGVFLRPSYQ